MKEIFWMDLNISFNVDNDNNNENPSVAKLHVLIFIQFQLNALHILDKPPIIDLFFLQVRKYKIKYN